MDRARQRVTSTFLDIAEVVLTPPLNGALYGWKIKQDTGMSSSSPLVYNVLRDLTRAGWVDSRWDDDSCTAGPRRRIYEVTDGGRAELVKLLARRRRRKLAVLHALLAGPSSAYDIARDHDIDVVDGVDAYQMLCQLASAGWATPVDTAADVSTRRAYRLTDAGREQAMKLLALEVQAA